MKTNGHNPKNAGGRDASGGLDRTKYLTTAEVTKLRRAVKDRALADEAEGRSTWSKNWMLIDLGLQTGLRVAEMANLRAEDIDLKGGESLSCARAREAAETPGSATRQSPWATTG